jgi:hypothetical protein
VSGFLLRLCFLRQTQSPQPSGFFLSLFSALLCIRKGCLSCHIRKNALLLFRQLHAPLFLLFHVILRWLYSMRDAQFSVAEAFQR